MAMKTGISWADSTANFWIGCTKVSSACDHCYAEEEQDHRRHRVQWGPHSDRSYCKQGWADIRKWNRAAAANDNVDPDLGRRRRVFINSLSDFFDNHASVTAWRAAAWDLIRECPNIVFMLVTKRPQNIRKMLPPAPIWNEIRERVWILTTAENQEEGDRRIPAMFEAFGRGYAEPAAFGVSCEPLLGRLDLSAYLDRLDWVIVGGESGKHARPMHPRWAEQLRNDCVAARVPFHFKQWGGWTRWTPDLSADVVYLNENGSQHNNPLGAGVYGVPVVNVGKAAAGREIGGRVFDEVPEDRRVAA